MLRIGLTGGIGSGKTTVAKVFYALGIPVFCADEEAKKMYLSIQVRKQMTNIFGNDIYINNTLNKHLLASKIFGNKQLLRMVNDIIHPLVHQRFGEWCVEQKSPYIIHEAAILIESDFYKLMDKIIVVNSTENLRINRIMERSNQSYEQTMQRIKNQMSDEKRNAYANFIINNNENIPLLPQILAIDDELRNSSQ